MKNELSQSEFVNQFKQSSRGESFSREALEQIYDLWVEMDLESDPIAIDCTYSEQWLKEIKKEYSDIKTLDDLQDRTFAIELDNGDILYDYNF